MSKIDCSNIYNFMSEWERRRKTKPNKTLYRMFLTDNFLGFNPFAMKKEELKEEVAELQKWSDEHPKMTRKEKCIKILEENGFVIADTCYNGYPYCARENCDRCQKYWDEEVDE